MVFSSTLVWATSDSHFALRKARGYYWTRGSNESSFLMSYRRRKHQSQIQLLIRWNWQWNKRQKYLPVIYWDRVSLCSLAVWSLLHRPSWPQTCRGLPASWVLVPPCPTKFFLEPEYRPLPLNQKLEDKADGIKCRWRVWGKDENKLETHIAYLVWKNFSISILPGPIHNRDMVS